MVIKKGPRAGAITSTPRTPLTPPTRAGAITGTPTRAAAFAKKVAVGPAAIAGTAAKKGAGFAKKLKPERRTQASPSRKG